MRPASGARRAALALVLTLAFAPAAGAEPRSEDDDKRARELFEIGDAHYAAGRYEESVKYFGQAYELSPHAALLFNIANAYERMERYKEAAEHLRRYLKSPKAENVAAVRERIRRLELSAKELEGVEAAGGDSSAAAPVTKSPLDAEEDQADRSNLLPYSLMGAGAAVIGAGVVFGLLSRQAGNDADALCTGDGLCTRNARRELDRQSRYALISDLSIGAGVLCAGAGAALWFLRRDTGEETGPERAGLRAIAPAFGSAGLGLEISGVF